MDIVGLQKAIDKLNDETIPQLDRIVEKLKTEVVDELHKLLDRLDGTQINVKMDIPPRGSTPQGSIPS
jgi:hypothetical protein